MSYARKNKEKLPIYLWIFITVELMIYVTYMYIDIVLSSNEASKSGLVTTLPRSQILSDTYLKYYSIIICLLVTAVLYYKSKTKTYALIAGAMFFTAFSDYFLLLNPDRMVPGLVSFCIVHAIYLYVILGGNIKRTAVISGIRIGISIITAIVLTVTGTVRFSNDSSLSAVMFLVILYGLSFVWNIILQVPSITLSGTSQNNKKTDAASRTCLFPHPIMFLIGLFLFLLCDLNVMIYNLGSFVNINSGLYNTLRASSVVLMWAFYLPSQVLIVLSAILPVQSGNH